MPRKEIMVKNAFTSAKTIARAFNNQVKGMDNRTKEEFRKDIKKRRVRKDFGKYFAKGGGLFIFNYDAIHKQNVFDKKPFIVCLGQVKKQKKSKENATTKQRKDDKFHFLGLNINWVKRQDHRTNLVALILELLDKNGELDYDSAKMIMNRFKASPILRRYSFNRVSPAMIKVPKDQYLMASRFNGPQFSS